MSKKDKHPAAVALGKLGGASRSPAKLAAARQNQKKAVARKKMLTLPSGSDKITGNESK